MKKIIIGTTIAILLLGAVAVGILYSLTTSDMQMWIMRHGLEKLSEKLQTRVSADSIGVDVKKGRIFLYGFEMDDRKSVRMLRVDTLEAKMQVAELVKKRVVIDEIMLHGIDANLYKEKHDSASNYQFVIDTFKKDKKKKTEKHDGDKIYVTLDSANMQRVEVRWNEDRFALASMGYDGRKQKLRLRGVTAFTDNGKARKNTGRPHRGAFDAGHLNSLVNIDLTLGEMKKDTVSFTIDHLDATDKESGIDLRDMTAKVMMRGDNVSISDLKLKYGNATSIAFHSLKARYTVTPGNKEKGIKKKVDFEIAPSQMQARVDLRDISAAFAPVLSHFTTPLKLDATVGGNMQRFFFNNIRVGSLDNRLQIKANGDLCNVKDKKKLCLHFNDICLTARNGIKEQIINHFAKKIKLKMIRQMKAIGDIRFDGSLGIFHKREEIAGCLQTKFGNVDVDFTINGNTKFMTGSMSSDSLEIGKIMNVDKVGPIKAKATYSFDTASNKKAAKKGKHQGRLPIGWLKAEVDNASYAFIHFKQITAEMKSDGTKAKGMVYVPQKLFDIITLFEYIQTDAEQTINVKPSITRHHKEGMTLEQREKYLEEKEARKLKKKQEKAERKAKKALEKERKVLEKERKAMEKAAIKRVPNPRKGLFKMA